MMDMNMDSTTTSGADSMMNMNMNMNMDTDMNMAMAFHTGISDILYSKSWKPTTTGQYAGTCIFLILLAIIHRFLAAFKGIQEAKWHAKERRRVIVVAGARPGTGNSSKVMMEQEQDLDEDAVREMPRNPWTAPWRFSTELPRAGLATVVSGVGYLLMLAVMTFNVGYFLSVLAGIFLGELAFGRISGRRAH